MTGDDYYLKLLKENGVLLEGKVPRDCLHWTIPLEHEPRAPYASVGTIDLHRTHLTLESGELVIWVGRDKDNNHYYAYRA